MRLHLAASFDIEGIYRRHVKTVYRLCYSFLGSAADAEDATQSVFMKLVASPREFEGEEHEKAWLIVCASNHCRDVLKSAARTRVVTLDSETMREPSTEDHVDEVLDCVLRLPDIYKDVVYLHYYEGYRTDEIAKITGAPPSTVRNRLRDARRLLKEALGGESDV